MTDQVEECCLDCGHVRDEHCGCGEHCLHPSGEQKVPHPMDPTQTMTLLKTECRCAGWRSQHQAN